MMHYFFSILFLINLSPVNMAGVWKLPVKKMVAELIILHPNIAEQKFNTIAIIRLNPSCKKPVSVPMWGNIIKSGKDVLVVLETKKVPLSNKCTYKFTLMAKGRLLGAKYKAEGVAVNLINCNGESPKTQVDKIDGIWIKKSSIGSSSIKI